MTSRKCLTRSERTQMGKECDLHLLVKSSQRAYLVTIPDFLLSLVFGSSIREYLGLDLLMS